MKAIPQFVFTASVLSTLFWSTSSNSLLSQDQSTAITTEMRAQIDQILSSNFDPTGPGYSLLIAQGDQVLYQNTSGLANLELGTTMTSDHVFKIASLTKQFTAVAILQLMESGKLNLDDRLSKFIPIHSKFPVTIEHLLTHTSGIPNHTNQPYWSAEIAKNDLSIDDQIDLFSKDTLLFEPGTDYSYSNTGYMLLGKIIEVVSGKTYASYVNEFLFAPIALENTTYNSNSKIIRNRASGYSKVDDGYQNATYLSDFIPYSGGGLVSTVKDFFQWHRSLQAGKLISKSNLDLAHTSHTLESGKSVGYGYGWQIGSFENERLIYHSAAINGFLADALFFPNLDLFFVMMTNCDCLPPGMSLGPIMSMILKGQVENEDQKSIPYGVNDVAGKYLTTEDAKIYYEVYGEGEPIVLLHGGMFGYIDEFSQYIPLLSKNYQVIAIATRGHGRSELGNRPLSYELFAEDASLILDNVNPQRATIIGFSDGAITAHAFASNYPSKTKKVVSLAGGFGAKWFRPEAKRLTQSLTADVLMQQYPAFVESRKAISAEPERWSEFISNLNALNLQELYLKEEEANKIQSPVLIVGGDRDDYFLVENFFHMHETLPNSQLMIIPNCGHVDLLGRKYVFEEIIMPFVLNE